jgi:hypothetical protein
MNEDGDVTCKCNKKNNRQAKSCLFVFCFVCEWYKQREFVNVALCGFINQVKDALQDSNCPNSPGRFKNFIHNLRALNNTGEVALEKSNRLSSTIIPATPQAP